MPPPVARETALLVLLLLLAGCRIEKRAEPAGVGADGAGPADTTVLVRAGGAVQDSVRSVVAAFHDALRVGDGARVAGLTVPGATLVDQEEGVQWRRDAGGGRLPEDLAASADGLGWRRVATDFGVRSDVALLVDSYSATVSGESVPWTAVETFVVVRTPAGWRIRHLHRSRGDGASAGTGSTGLR